MLKPLLSAGMSPHSRRLARGAVGATALIALSMQVVSTAGASPTDPTLSIFAGTGTPGGVTPGPATSSDLANPVGLTIDRFGNTYIADLNNGVIEKVTPT